MGCVTSTGRRCRHCQAPLSPDRPMEVRSRLPRQNVDGSYHMVALKSSTPGSLNLDRPDEDHGDAKLCNGYGELPKVDILNGLSMVLIEAKTWSNRIDEKIRKVVPKTPVTTPLGEPEMINEWELMDGLEDEVSPFRSPNLVRSFSFDVMCSPSPHAIDLPKSRFRVNSSVLPELDPEIIATLRKSLQELSPDHPFHTHPSNSHEDESTDVDENEEDPAFLSKQKVVLYFTSLRGVRKTYEDCCHVRMILKGIGVRIDERDVSMHSGFKEEIAELLGDDIYRGVLPRVFVGRNYIGGSDEVKRMHDEGELEKVLEGCERADDVGNACEVCMDVRFVPYETCRGSCKVYYGEAEEFNEGVIGFRRCPDCNENGLIRCPSCWY